MTRILALSFLGIIILVMLSPLLFFNQIFLVGDTLHFSYPAAQFFKTHYLSGLNPYLYLGFPLASSFHYAYFNPVYLIIFPFFDIVTAYHLILLFDCIIAALFCYFLATSLNLNERSALVVTVTYILSQFSTFWLSSITITNGLFLLPASCFLITKLTSKQVGDWRYVFGVPVIFGYAFLSTHYQFIVMACVGSLLFLLYRLWDQYAIDESIVKNLRSLSLYLIGLLGGLIIGLPQIWNTFRFFKYITRSDFITYDYLRSFDLIRYLLPDFNIATFTSQEFLPYIGMVPLCLVIFALVYSYKVKRHTLVTACVASFLLFFSLMVAYSPTALLLQHLPIFRYFAQPVRWLLVCNMYLALMAGIGFQLLISDTHSDVTHQATSVLKNVLYCFSFIIILSNIGIYLLGNYFITIAQNYFDQHIYIHTSKLPLDYYHSLVRILAENVFHTISILNPNVDLFFVVTLLLYLLCLYRKQLKFFPELLVLLLICNLLGSFFLNTKLTNKKFFLNQPQLAKQILTREQDAHSFRVFSYLVPEAQYQKISALNPGESEAVEQFALEGLMGNVNNLDLVGGLEPNGDKKVQQIVYFYLNEKSDNFSAKLPILSALNTKYIVTPYELTNPALALVASTSVTKFNVPLFLYQNKTVLPRIYFPNTITYLKPNDDSANLTTVLKPDNSFGQQSYVECDTCSQNQVGNDITDTLQVVTYNDEYVAVQTNTRHGRWIIISNANVLGWQASLDKQPVQIYPANYALQAVYVPAGKHMVEMTYTTKWWPL